MSFSPLKCEIGSTKNNFNKENIQIGVNCRLTVPILKFLTTQTIAIQLHPDSYSSMQASYNFLREEVDARVPMYGVNTNFGDQVKYIDPHLNDTNKERYFQSILCRQHDIVKSLVCSVGEFASPASVKACMVLRAHCLAQGYSAVPVELVENMLQFINAGIVPMIGRYGSIGASGDLIPLATMAAAFMGEEVAVWYRGDKLKAGEALEKANLKKMNLHYRDGLALINGTSFMSGVAGLALFDLIRLFKQMLFAIGMALESLLVISSSYNPLVHQLKLHEGENCINQFLLDYWRGSKLLTDLKNLQDAHAKGMSGDRQEPIKSLQDYYSLRAVPQGFGTFQENLQRAQIWIENEMNSVNDNPLFDVKNRQVLHNANFMGYYISNACDILKMDIAQASTWIHALLANMVHSGKNIGLPVNLATDPSHNGVRALQLLAAALAVQNRKKAQSHPSFILPTEGDNQDVNSLGAHAAFDLEETVVNLEYLTAILFLASAQALDFRGIEKAGEKTQAIHKIIREVCGPLKECRPLTGDIDRLVQLLKSEKI